MNYHSMNVRQVYLHKEVATGRYFDGDAFTGVTCPYVQSGIS